MFKKSLELTSILEEIQGVRDDLTTNKLPFETELQTIEEEITVHENTVQSTNSASDLVGAEKALVDLRAKKEFIRNKIKSLESEATEALLPLKRKAKVQIVEDLRNQREPLLEDAAAKAKIALENYKESLREIPKVNKEAQEFLESLVPELGQYYEKGTHPRVDIDGVTYALVTVPGIVVEGISGAEQSKLVTGKL